MCEPSNEMSQRPAKRSRCSRYTLEEKLEAVIRVRDGHSKMSVARFLNIPESTLRGWCKAESKLRTQLNNTDTSINGASRSSSESTSRRRAATTSTTDMALRNYELRPDDSFVTGPSHSGSSSSFAEGMLRDLELEAGPPSKQPRLDNLPSAATTTVGSNDYLLSARARATEILRYLSIELHFYNYLFAIMQANSTTLDEHVALYHLRATYITYVNHMVNNAVAVLRSDNTYS